MRHACLLAICLLVPGAGKLITIDMEQPDTCLRVAWSVTRERGPDRARDRGDDRSIARIGSIDNSTSIDDDFGRRRAFGRTVGRSVREEPFYFRDETFYTFYQTDRQSVHSRYIA